MGMKRLNYYIDWLKRAQIIKVSHEEFKIKYDFVKKKGYKSPSKTKVVDWYSEDLVWKVVKKGKFMNLYVQDHLKLYIYTTNDIDSTKDGASGTKAIQMFSEKFAEDIGRPNSKRPIYEAFGVTEKEFLYCVPKQFYYINSNYIGVELDGVSSVDATAHYPSNACGALPDAHTAVRYEGTVKPTKEFPFAFYLKSGHSAEYDRYDTHEWVKQDWFDRMFDLNHLMNPVREEDDVTILMKASKYTMDKTWKYFFDKRKENKDFKLVMNATIGNFHRRSYKAYKYAHLAAVIIARANDKQLRLMRRIGKRNVLHTCVDGIIYKGTYKIGYDFKEMNTYQQEFTNCKFKMLGTNIYMAMNNDEVVKYKHGSFNKIKGTEEFIDDNPPKDFGDMNKWYKYDILEGIRNENS